MSGSIEIRLNRHTKIYNENVSDDEMTAEQSDDRPAVAVLTFQDIVQGTVVIASPTSFKHNGITLTVDGSVQLHLSGKSVGVFEAFYNSTKVCSVLSLIAAKSRFHP